MKFTDAIGRYGVAYVAKVCAQAHVGFSETGPGQDVLAIDGRLEFAPLDVRVQIKGTTQYSLQRQDGLISFPIEEGWRNKWRQNQGPAYFILVLLEHEVEEWFVYDECTTLAGAYALWARIDNIPADATHLHLDRRQRFTAETVSAWNDDLYAGYGEEVDEDE